MTLQEATAEAIRHSLIRTKPHNVALTTTVYELVWGDGSSGGYFCVWRDIRDAWNKGDKRGARCVPVARYRDGKEI